MMEETERDKGVRLPLRTCVLCWTDSGTMGEIASSRSVGISRGELCMLRDVPFRCL